jgi:hypothetical protein
VLERDDAADTLARGQLFPGMAGTPRAQDRQQAREPAQDPQGQRREVDRAQSEVDYARCSARIT